MNIVKRQTINLLGIQYPRAKKQLDVWYHEAKNAKWKSPTDIKDESKGKYFEKQKSCF